MDESSIIEPVGLVDISISTLAVSLLPLVGVAFASHQMGLQLESPIVVGMIRAFVQLSILGAILVPIFYYGTLRWWIVAIYMLFMIVLASYEASSRSLYYFKGMSLVILLAFLVNIVLISIFAFGIVIRPTPVWDPQYVIPIVGMLLGNCINGVALAVNSILTGFVEQASEIELYLSFGATSGEASARLVQEAVRIGAMPTLNSMSVIGLISIPGMMTGQILGGSPVQEAARYQMLIMYLIATVTFGTILLEAWFVRQVAFSYDHRLDTSHFIKRPAKTSFLERVGNGLKAVSDSLLRSSTLTTTTPTRDTSMDHNERTPLKEAAQSPIQLDASSVSSSPEGSIELVHMGEAMASAAIPRLEMRRMSRTVSNGRILFQDLSVQLQMGEIVAVRGPSGIGKSQLLRLVAGLVRNKQEDGEIFLDGENMNSFHMTRWRREVRYVSQYKIEIPGTPTDFIKYFMRFGAWKRQPLTPADVLSATTALVTDWGMGGSVLNAEWKQLSGGEAQRVFLAIAIASQPAALLMDESTSALDHTSKRKVEESVRRIAAQRGIAVLMITHDEGQVERMGKASSVE